MNRRLRKTLSRRSFLKILSMFSCGVLRSPGKVFASLPDASTVMRGGKVITIDGNNSITQAIAIRNDRILDVGSDDQIGRYIGHGTAVIDLKGKTVTPGLVDAHAHLPHFGNRERNWVKLQGVESKEEVLEYLADRARKTPPGRFIYGWGVESLDFSFMDRRDLDRVTTNHPVLAVHTTGQWGFANSFALGLSGIDRTTPNPPGGRVQKVSNGEPTGLLIHYPALYLVRKNIPPLNEEEISKNIQLAARLYAQEGVTTVHDNFFDVAETGSTKHAGVYLGQTMSGSLPVRVKIWPYIPSMQEASFALRELFQSQNPRTNSPFMEIIRHKKENPEGFARVWGGMKIAIDGSGPTALWYRSERSVMLHSAENLHSMVKLFHMAGQQVSVHAVGDKAVDVMLDAFEEAYKAQPRDDSRHRIEHAMCPQKTSLDRIKRLGVVVSTHPQFIYPWADRWVGLKGQRIIPLKTYREIGIPVALGADPPAFPLWQPQYALWEAVVRITKGGYRFAPEEAVSVQEALRMQTMGSAYAAFQEKEIGSVEKGKMADLVIWDRDFYTVPSGQIREAKVELTMKGGKIVYTNPESGFLKAR